MRLFAGVELDETVKAAAAEAAERLRLELARVAPSLVARWIPAPNLHITVWFIGDVPEARAETLAAGLAASPFQTPACELAFQGCGAFPPVGPPRVFWIGVTQGGAAVASLHAEVAARLATHGLLPERRAYAPHLTIGRVKDPGRGTSRRIRNLLPGVPANCGTSRVSALTLFQSRLSGRGAVYEPLLRVPLRE